MLDLNDKQIEGVFRRLIKNKQVATELIENSLLSNEQQEKYKNLMEERYKAIII